MALVTVLLGGSSCASRSATTRSDARHQETSAATHTTTAGASIEPVSSARETEPDITRYATRLTLDVTARALSGTTALSYLTGAPGTKALRLPANGLELDAVEARGTPVPFRIEDGIIIIDLPVVDAPRSPSQGGEPHAAERHTGTGQIEIAYHATPERGLVFGPGLVYTNFFTCHWMPCKEQPGDKASFELEMVVPEPLSVVASGQLVEQALAAPGQTRFVWREQRPYSTYLYGFAVGQFSRATLRAGDAELRLLGVDLPAAALEARFRPTADMLRYFESRATIPLPHPTYTQILVPGSQAQEKSSFSLIGRDELDPILSDPSEDWVIAHELAHQWWGNLITCKDWSHFWLNEGVTTFMVTAYKEQRWGARAYERELELFRARHQHAIDANFDVKLAFAGEYPSLTVKRAITYSKAALFLHTLRRDVGDDAFWAGLGRFTRERAGQSVESRDFQQDLEAATGRDLSTLFGSWVFD